MRIEAIKHEPVTLFRLNLPNGFSYVVLADRDGKISASYGVTVGFLSFKSLKFKFDRDWQKKMKIMNFLNGDGK